jgi:N-acetylglucosaminyldiphosphoundecaprenol N-acetyl-beta-D-mannosaminyltransferase
MATIPSIHPTELTHSVASQEVTDILGVQISAITMDDAVQNIERWIDQRQKQYVCICTVNNIISAQDDPAYMELVNNAGMRTPDGMPLVWLSHRAGHTHVTRVYGPDLMLEMCARSSTTGHRHFFYGGGPGVVDELTKNLANRYPGLDIVGKYTPGMLALGEMESQDTIDMINASGADIVWVGLNSPKQDWWVANHRHLLNAPVLLAVGAAFDFHSGRVRQAPGWMQRNGLEWLFRLTQDPKRLWKRYVFQNSRFIGLLALNWLRGGSR